MSDNQEPETDYPYYKYIKTPSKMGMSSKGDLKTLGKDINGLSAYVSLLVSGKSKASKTGKPLGNKYFMETGMTCTDKLTDKRVERSIYINNIPSGNIPFISSGMGVNFKEFKGLIPGLIGNLNTLDPRGLIKSFSAPGTPYCKSVTLEVVDTNNERSTETKYLTLTDLKSTDPCWFRNKKNPETNESCNEGLENPVTGNEHAPENQTTNNLNDQSLDTKDEIAIAKQTYQFVFIGLVILMLFILYNLYMKKMT